MCRYCHDSTCTVTHHYIVGYVDRYLFAGHRIYCCKSFDLDSCLVLYKLCPLELALLCTFSLVIVKCLYVCYGITVLLDDRMLRSNDHEGYTIECVRTCGVYPQLLILLLYPEVHECTCGLAYPVLLLELYVGKVINLFKSLKELVCVLCDTEVPYFLCLLDYIAVAYVTFAAL